MEMCVLGFSGGRGMKVLICLAIIMALWLFWGWPIAWSESECS